MKHEMTASRNADVGDTSQGAAEGMIKNSIYKLTLYIDAMFKSSKLISFTSSNFPLGTLQIQFVPKLVSLV